MKCQREVRMNVWNGRRKLLEGKRGGGSKQGKPRLRWLDDVEWDLMNEYGCENMGNRNCGRSRMGDCRVVTEGKDGLKEL
jgi:hypothetical protein